jgi:hypothetical protein
MVRPGQGCLGDWDKWVEEFEKLLVAIDRKQMQFTVL